MIELGKRCACGEGPVGASRVWVNACADHGEDECVTQDWTTPRMRLCMWLSGLVDACWGPARKDPKVTRISRPAPRGPGEAP